MILVASTSTIRAVSIPTDKTAVRWETECRRQWAGGKTSRGRW
jgi:hypothetical protein